MQGKSSPVGVANPMSAPNRGEITTIPVDNKKDNKDNKENGTDGKQ